MNLCIPAPTGDFMLYNYQYVRYFHKIKRIPQGLFDAKHGWNLSIVYMDRIQLFSSRRLTGLPLLCLESFGRSRRNGPSVRFGLWCGGSFARLNCQRLLAALLNNCAVQLQTKPRMNEQTGQRGKNQIKNGKKLKENTKQGKRQLQCKTTAAT